MPRPKRNDPLIPRTVRLTDDEYEKLQLIGGADWLRMTLRTMKPKSVTKAVRNLQIIQDHKAGMTDMAISEKFGLDRATVWRARQ